MTAAGAQGETVIENAARLRLKESDRLQSTAELLRRLGYPVTELPDGLVIKGGQGLTGGTVTRLRRSPHRHVGGGSRRAAPGR